MKRSFLTLAIPTCLFLSAPLGQADLPSLSEKPWLGYFVGFSDRKFQFGVTGQGEALLFPLKRDGSVSGLFSPIKVKYEILETTPDGKVVSKQIQDDTLTSSQPASANPESPVKFSGKVTGDAAFELTAAPERGGFSLSGKITDKGTLTNPLQFAITIDFDPHPNGASPGANGEKSASAEKFEKKIKGEEIRLRTVGGDREKIDFLDKVNASALHPDGYVEAETRTEGYSGINFALEAVGKSKMTFEDKGENYFWKGFSLRWTVNPDGDPAQAKLVVTAK